MTGEGPSYRYSNVAAGLGVIAFTWLVFIGLGIATFEQARRGRIPSAWDGYWMCAIGMALTILLLFFVGSGKVDSREISWAPLIGRRVRIRWDQAVGARLNQRQVALSDGRRKVQVAWQDVPADTRDAVMTLARQALRDFDFTPDPPQSFSPLRVLLLAGPMILSCLLLYQFVVRSLQQSNYPLARAGAVGIAGMLALPYVLAFVLLWRRRGTDRDPGRWRRHVPVASERA